MQKKKITIVNDDGLAIKVDSFQPYIDQLRNYNFSAKEAKKEGKTYVGEAGVSELFRKISSFVAI